MSQKHAAVAVIIAVISEKNKSSKKKKKRRAYMLNLGLKEEKSLGSYETLLAELRLEHEHNYSILLQMTFENFQEIF